MCPKPIKPEKPAKPSKPEKPPKKDKDRFYGILLDPSTPDVILVEAESEDALNNALDGYTNFTLKYVFKGKRLEIADEDDLPAD